jgi:hypothetical protein
MANRSDLANSIARFMERNEKLPNIIAAGKALITMREVDKYVKKFADSVIRDTPRGESGQLAGSFNIVRTVRKGAYGRLYYGWRVLFDGYNDDRVPLQLIANVLNHGRVAGIAENGRAISNLQGIRFIDRNLRILREINPAIEENLKIGGWSASDEELEINDGSKIDLRNIITASAGHLNMQKIVNAFVANEINWS